ncbi:S41 family peptidase [Aureivirga sp. CE67]|uniref:S41 family peptidase n=1 Tax=Aureivirga sp. CE67 TaxID=1788983 RepID=UPI0018C8F6EE|nr:S41 family peptidase [Aureivirga sp. CE67]
MKKILSILLFSVFTFQFQAQELPNTLSKTDKIYGLSKFWQEVNYNFIYLNDIDKEEWDKLYQKMLVDVQETKNDYEYYRLLKKFCAFLKDGHTNVYYPEAIQEQNFTTYFGEYRIVLKNIQGKAIIVRVNKSKKDELPIGTEIVKVNGIPSKEYREKNVKPYMSSSTDYVLEDASTLFMLQGLKGTEYELELKLPNGKTKMLHVVHEETTEKEVYPPYDDKLFKFKWLKNKTAYVSLNSFNDPKIIEDFRAILPDLKKAKKLIIDLRYNGGGNSTTGLEILKHLSNDTIFYGSKTRTRMNLPAYKAWGGWVEPKDTVNNERAKKWFLAAQDKLYFDMEDMVGTSGPNIKTRLVVPTAVLIGHNTASAAEDFLIYADNQKHFTKIGVPTNGSTGQPLFMKLPGGGQARVCSKEDLYPDGRKFVGVGIQPDIVVEKTVEDFINDEDPVLEYAVKYLKKQ